MINVHLFLIRSDSATYTWIILCWHYGNISNNVTNFSHSISNVASNLSHVCGFKIIDNATLNS
jgi:hypothetical protein